MMSYQQQIVKGYVLTKFVSTQRKVCVIEVSKFQMKNIGICGARFFNGDTVLCPPPFEMPRFNLTCSVAQYSG